MGDLPSARSDPYRHPLRFRPSAPRLDSLLAIRSWTHLAGPARHAVVPSTPHPAGSSRGGLRGIGNNQPR